MADTTNVLLIEDDESHAKIVSRYLARILDERMILTHARNLGEGLEKIKNESFHIVLLDLRLPDSDLNETLPRILEQTTELPIVILSSIADLKLARKMVHEGAQEYLCKSDLTSDLLLRSIYSCIERKRVEVALKRSEAIKRQIIASSLDCVISMNDDGKIIEFNPAAEKIFGNSRERFVGEKMFDILVPARFKDDHITDFIVDSQHGTRSFLGKRREIIAVRGDGTEFPAEWYLVSVKVGSRYIFTGFLRDISEQKKFAEKLKEAKEAAEAANHAKSAFLANMSHEIRTPLGVILGFSDLLADPLATQEEKIRYATAIRRNGELLSNIINDILDLSKIEAGKTQVEIREVDLNEFLTDTESFHKFSAQAKGIQLSITKDKSAPSTITTDPVRLRQIIGNIVGNAIKFTDGGRVSLNAKWLIRSSGVPTLEFIVEDTGRGISDEEAQKLFAPFSQGDISSKRKYGGTGLGLILAKRLARLLGGDVVLTKSTPHEGSVFTVSIDPGPVQFREENLKTGIGQISTKQTVNELLGQRILVAEDSPDNQFLVRRILMSAGAQVDITQNGKEAVEAVEKKEYDTILMDLQMPVMDGYEATSTLRMRGFNKTIIALTAHALMEEKKRCLASGFDDHVSKPIDRHELLESIIRHSDHF